MKAPPEDLEVLPLEDDGAGTDEPEGPVETPLRRRWWPWAAAIAVLLAVIAGGTTGYRALHRSSFRSMERLWWTADAIDRDRLTQLLHLQDVATPADEDLLQAATTALVKEENARLARIRRQLAGRLVIDGRLRSLLHSMDRAMRARRFDSPDVARRLAAERRRWNVRPAPVPPNERLTSARAARRALSHYLDEPTGARLITFSPGQGVELLDIDASTRRRVPVLGAPSLSSTDGVIVSGGGAFVVDGSSSPRLLGAADDVVPSVEPGRVWLLSRAGAGQTYPVPVPAAVVAAPTTATEVDLTGRAPRRPFDVPPGWTVVAATTRGLVLQRAGGSGTLALWAPEADALPHLLADCATGRVVARGSAIAWSECGGGRMHVADLATGSDRVVFGARPESFSPDGRTLAAVAVSRRLWLVDVATGRVTGVPAGVHRYPAALAPAVVWAPSGRWLFFLDGDGSRIAAYRIGAPHAVFLRVRIDGLMALAAAP